MSKTKDVLQKAVQITMDGWSNILTGLGVGGMDKRMAAEVAWMRLTQRDAEHLYSGDDISSNIVDVVPDESLSRGYNLIGIEKPYLEKAEDIARKMNLDKKVNEVWKIGRLYGGALLLKIHDDSELSTPNQGAKLKNLIPISRWEITPDVNNITVDPFSPNFGKPEKYRLHTTQQAGQVQGYEVHHSRCIRFDGQMLPLQLYKNNNHWHDSVLNKLQNAIRNYNISHDAAAATLQDFSIPVMKLQNLAEQLEANCEQDIKNRLQMVNLTKSIARMVVLDANNESFEHSARNVTGFADLLNKVESRLATAAHMPRTKLFGESSGGLGSTGESQENNWNKYIESQQENYLRPILMELYKEILRGEFPNLDLNKLDIEFVPLKQMTEKEQADIRKTQADIDNIYLQHGVIDSTEVAKSRFGGDKYSTDTKIDLQLRTEIPSGEALVNPNDPNNPQPALNQPSVDPSADATTKAVALNGAQVTALQDLVVNVQNGTLELDTGKKLAMVGFGLDQNQVNNLFADVKPKSQEAPQPFSSENFNFKKGNKFDMEFPLLAANGEPLNLDGYEFKGYFKSHPNANDNLASFDVVKTDKTGVIRAEVGADIVDKVLSVRMDGADQVNCYAFIKMIKPNGQSKIIKSTKAVFK